MTKSHKLNYLILLILGIISSFSLPPYNYFILNFVSYTFFFIFIFEGIRTNHSFLKLFLYGWFFGFGYFLSSLYWISISLTFDDNFKFLIPLGLNVYHSRLKISGIFEIKPENRPKRITIKISFLLIVKVLSVSKFKLLYHTSITLLSTLP